MKKLEKGNFLVKEKENKIHKIRKKKNIYSKYKYTKYNYNKIKICIKYIKTYKSDIIYIINMQ